MNKKAVPYLIGIPNMGVGILWSMNMVLIPLLVSQVTKSNLELAMVVSMGAFTGIFVQYLAGLLSDRSNFKMGKRKPFILMGALATTISLCLLPFAESYFSMFLLAFVFYFSLNFYQGPYYSMIPETVESNQLGLAMGFSKVISIVGSAIIFVAGPILWKMDKKLPFLMAAVLGAVTVFGAMFLIKENNKNYSRPEKLSFDFHKFPSIVKLYMAILMIYLAYGCVTPFFVKYCVNYLKISEGNASLALLVLTIVGALTAYPIGLLADRLEKRKVLFYGVIIFAVSLFAGIFVKDLLWLFAVMSFIGIGFIDIQITSYSILAEISPKERLGEFMGIMNLFISLGQFTSNNIMGYVLDKYGFGVFFIVPAVLMSISAGIIYFSRFNPVSKKITNEA